MTYDNRNKGTIAKNTRKESDTHPDIAGQINVEGKDYWINGWLKKNSQDGSTFYSLSLKPKEARQQQSSPPRRQAPPPADFSDLRGAVGPDDDIPFAPSF